jgi:hypothetical protein
MTSIHRRGLLASAAAATLVPAGARAQSGWTPKASLPWPVQEIYATVWNGRIVTAGGLKLTANQPLHVEDRVAVYDPATDAWSEAARMREPRHHPMLATVRDQLWLVGGYARTEAGEWVNSAKAWRLDNPDPRARWATAVDLPSPQAEAVGVVIGERLHLIGGRSPAGEANAAWADHADVDTHRVYDAASLRWETLRPLPMARNSSAGALLDGAVWVAGGRTVRGGGTGRLDRYDPVADRWDTLAPIPVSPAGQQVGGGLAMAAAGGRLVAFGGEWFAPGGGGGVFPETWIYDPAADRWERGPDMPTPRHGLAAAAIGRTVYAIAGGSVVSGGRAAAVVEALGL